MPVIETESKRKLFQVAKEFNLAHTTLMEFLNIKGYDTPKKHMSIVTQEMYEEIVQKFDQLRWRKHLEELSQEKEIVKKKAIEDLREKELERILTEAPKAAKKTPSLVLMEEPSGVQVKAGMEAPPTAMKAEPLSEPKELKKEKVKTEVQKIVELTPEEKAAEIISSAIIEDQVGAVLEIEKAPDLQEMAAVDKVVEEALQFARRSAKKEILQAVETEKEDKEATVEKKKRKRRRRKKPRRPEAPSPAAIDMEKERRAKRGKKKFTLAEEPEQLKKQRRVRKKKIDLKEIDASIKETLAKIEERGRGKRKRKRTTPEGEVVEDANLLKVTEFVSAQELSNLMDIEVTEIIGKAMEMGLLISINQRLDKDNIVLLADEFGFNVEFLSSFEEEIIEPLDADKLPQKPRPPVVTVMGHVDHGKTSLLDYIRRSNIIAGESGGITQHIGAYKVYINGRQITFLDTPGHEAFTAMRARGAQVTDIVVLVIAADDQVMPQTIEAIDHAQAAGVPLIIVINKIDKPNAQPEKVKQQLADRGILVEEWGGKYQCAEISAKFGTGVEKLMDEILLLADMLELKAPQECPARGVVIDAKLDRGRGSIATVLIQNGSLKVGDNFISGQYFGKVRALLDERSQNLIQAFPSDPIQILGLSGTPQAGDKFYVIDSEREAKSISTRRQQLYREQSFRQIRTLTLEQMSKQIKFGEINTLPLIIKGDVHGSVEALSDALMKLRSQEVTVEVIHRGVGAITESDVLLAAASGAIIIGFHVHANKKARDLALQEQVEIKSYRIIYDVIDEVKKAIEGMLKPEISEQVTGELEVREVYKISAIGNIAGCYVTEGKIERTSKVRIFREGVEIFTGDIESLKRFKDDVREVASGFECGLKIKNFNDIKPNDVIQTYKIVETKRTLSELEV